MSLALEINSLSHDFPNRIYKAENDVCNALNLSLNQRLNLSTKYSKLNIVNKSALFLGVNVLASVAMGRLWVALTNAPYKATMHLSIISGAASVIISIFTAHLIKKGVAINNALKFEIKALVGIDLVTCIVAVNLGVISAPLGIILSTALLYKSILQKNQQFPLALQVKKC